MPTPSAHPSAQPGHSAASPRPANFEVAAVATNAPVPAALPNWMNNHPRLLAVGLLGANLFGLVGLVAILSGALHSAQQTVPTSPSLSPLTAPPSFASSDSNNRMIAVCGVDATGSSILYLVDTEAKQLAVYQANGGGRATQNVRLVGARKIDLDLQLIGFHDDSEYSYEDLEKRFERIEQPTRTGGR